MSKIELSPIGLIEQTLVECISIAMWRQKWPLRSETTHIDFTCQPKQIALEINIKFFTVARQFATFSSLVKAPNIEPMLVALAYICISTFQVPLYCGIFLST